ncbi:MAG: InlB B-repeat-containing protein, partial [Muribaculaceae bacterium]|nr:InlB B-repeat-containing protein [Muribaculaceae bacterium]
MTSIVNSSTANLVAAYDFNNIQGLSVEDISGNGHTGTLVGFPEPDVQYTARVIAGSNGTANVNDSTSVTVNSGTEVTYTATANEGYVFAGWSNGSTTVSTENPYIFNITSNIELTANFQEVGMSVVQLDRTNWSVTASTQEPAEAQWGGGGETRHAIDNSETTFWHSQWDASKPTVPHWIQFNLGGLYEISAINYVSRSSVTNQNNGQIKDYRLYISSSDISANINSTTYVPNGLEPVKDDVFTYGTTNHHNVTLDAPVIGQYIYLLVDDSYNVDESGIKFANCAEFYASGKPAYTVSATASPNNGGTASVSANVIGAGGSVVFTATPSTGYNFAGWYNGENKVSEDTEYTATNIKSTLSLTAKFEKQTFEVSVTAGAGGSVSSITNPVEYGTSLELTATADQGYKFTGWSDGSTENPYTVTVTDNISLVANFVAIPTYTVTVTTNGNGSVEKSAGSVLAGNTVTLTATPATGYRFVDWSDGSKANPRTITVTEDVYLTANFVEVSQDAPLLTFACLSDLHAQQDFISDANNIRLRESVTKTLKAIKEQQEKVDLIVLGGDYTS